MAKAERVGNNLVIVMTLQESKYIMAPFAREMLVADDAAMLHELATRQGEKCKHPAECKAIMEEHNKLMRFCSDAARVCEAIDRDMKESANKIANELINK